MGMAIYLSGLALCNEEWANGSRTGTDVFEEAPPAYDGSAGLRESPFLVAIDKNPFCLLCFVA